MLMDSQRSTAKEGRHIWSRAKWLKAFGKLGILLKTLPSDHINKQSCKPRLKIKSNSCNVLAHIDHHTQSCMCLLDTDGIYAIEHNASTMNSVDNN